MQLRPWYRWHWLTWLVGGLVAWALTDRQFEERLTLDIGYNHDHVTLFSLGWPLPHLTSVETVYVGSMIPPAVNVSRIENEWFGWQLVMNCLACALMAGATIFVCETWMRSARRLQFETRHLLVIVAVVSALLALNREWAGPSLVTWSDVIQPIRWPALMALACAVYFLGWLVLRVGSRACAGCQGSKQRVG